jgi:trehalose 6-phosphate phosphatase
MFDFDGTLSPLAAERATAELDPACSGMLRKLAAVKGYHCAVISSRHLSDLEGRVDIPWLYLAGGSGLEWRLPGGGRQGPDPAQMEKIGVIRKLLIPEIRQWEHLPGVEIEDKHWSIAIHVRRALPQTRRQLAGLIERWRKRRDVRVFNGTEAVEIPLLPGIDKSYGVHAFGDLLHCNLPAVRLVYAGDDDNDRTAMGLVRDLGGTAITVGEKALLPGTEVVSSPRELAGRILLLAGL